MYSSNLFLTSALDMLRGQRHGKARLPLGITWLPLSKGLGGAQGCSGRDRGSIPGQSGL